MFIAVSQLKSSRITRRLLLLMEHTTPMAQKGGGNHLEQMEYLANKEEGRCPTKSW